MKGIGIEFVGRIMAAAFVIVMIVILLQTFLPNVFSKTLCYQKQIDSLNALINDATASRSTAIESFSVESCVAYVDFRDIQCQKGASTEVQRCVEILPVGQNDGNCYTTVKSGIQDPANLVKICDADKCDDKGDSCSSHKGNLIPLPGGHSVFEVTGHSTSTQNPDGTVTEDPLMLKPGRYGVEVGPYSIKFLQAQPS